MPPAQDRAVVRDLLRLDWPLIDDGQDEVAFQTNYSADARRRKVMRIMTRCWFHGKHGGFENEEPARQNPALLPAWRKEILERMQQRVGDDRGRAKLFATVTAPSFQDYVREDVRVGSLADLHDSWVLEDRRRDGDPRIVCMLDKALAERFVATLKAAPMWGLGGPVVTNLTPDSDPLLEPLLERARMIWEEDAASLRHDLGYILGGGLQLDFLPKRARISRPRHVVSSPIPWNSAIGRANGAIELLRLNLEPFGLEVRLDRGSLD